MSERLSTGQRRLDEILHGGILKNAITLVVGAPGSGKTILSEQIVFQNASAHRPALYLSTVSEPFDKILRYSQSLDFFDKDAIKDGVVVYEDVGGVLVSDGLDGVLAKVGTYVRGMRPGVLVIDSFRPFHAFAEDDAAFRRFLAGLTRQLTASATTSLWIDEYSRAPVQDAAEFAVADAIIVLDSKQIGDRELRTLQVQKVRGSGFSSGQHAYRISSSGLQVFPRLADIQDLSPYATGTARLESGIPALDDMLGDGLWPGASTLLVGPTGVGKTLVGLHFLFHGTSVGQPGIHATFQENPTQLARIISGFGWSLETEGLHLLSRSLVDVYIDQWVYELLELAESVRAQRIVIDSLADVQAAAGDETRFREWMYSLVQRCNRQGITMMLTNEVPELYDIRRLSENALSHLADNVVVLQYARDSTQVTRTLTVLKTRGSRHDQLVRRYEITSEGLTLEARVDG